MRFRNLFTVAVACVAGLAIAAPCAASTPPESNQRIVLSTPQGDILIALAPENAPHHVEQFLIALAAGDFDGSTVVRVSPSYYVQMIGKPGVAQLAGLAVERLKVGNLRGALSVYDSGKPGEIPTLTLILVNSPQLDPDYTSIGFVEAGMSIAEAIANVPTVGDNQPAQPITISSIHLATQEERQQLLQSEQSAASNGDDTSQLAAVFIVACAAFVAAMISAFHDRLTKQRMASLALLVVLLAFFAIWVALAGTEHGDGLVGVALFCGAIGIFRLMGRFEPPPTPAPDPSPVPSEPQDADSRSHDKGPIANSTPSDGSISRKATSR
jgi:cyclophilin family peptidyl-prolyl cis-trans isomerase